MRTTRAPRLDPATKKDAASLLSKADKRTPFMEWVLNSNTALRVTIVFSAIFPLILLVLWLAFSFNRALQEPWWWLSVAVTVVICGYAYKRMKDVLGMVFLYRDQSINKLVYGRKDKKAEE